MLNVLLVDDEPHVLSALSRELRRLDCYCTTHENPTAALLTLDHQDFDMVFSDFRMPSMDGAQFLRKVLNKSPNVVRVAMSGQADMRDVLQLINNATIFRYLEKPWDADTLHDIVAAAREFRGQLKATSEALRHYRMRRDRTMQRAAVLARLEALEPGITHVDWSPDGTVILSDSP